MTHGTSYFRLNKLFCRPCSSEMDSFHVIKFKPTSTFSFGLLEKCFCSWQKQRRKLVNDQSCTSDPYQTFSAKVSLLNSTSSPRKRSADLMLQQFLSVQSPNIRHELLRNSLFAPGADTTIISDRDIPLPWLWPSSPSNPHSGPRPRFVSCPVMGLHYYNDWMVGKRGKHARINTKCLRPHHIF